MTWECLAVATVSPSIGELRPIGVARGTYTEITEIVAPDSAAMGERVDVTVKVRNFDTVYDHIIACVAVVDGLRFIDEAVIISSGETYSYSGAFLMGGGKVTIYAYTYYPYYEEWIEDDRAQKDIALAEVYAGTIIGIELEHDGIQEGLPVYNIPQGQTARVHVWGRNDMATVQKLGIHWIVRDPDREVVEDYDDWSFLGYRQGADHKFSGGYHKLDKPGTYTINIALSMNPADAKIVDSYYGNLCTVAEVAPPPEVWVKLAERRVTITPEVVPPPEVWEKLAERRVTITPEVVELIWEKLAERRVTITPEVVEIWEKLAERRVTITPEVIEWLKLTSKTITLTPEVVEVWQKLAAETVTITPEEIPPEFELIQHTIYPYAYIYEGDVEVSVATFKTDPFSPSAWMGEKFASKLEEEVRARGGRPIEVKVYVDTTPLLWTNFRIEVTGTPLGETVEAGLDIAVGIALWLAILLVCLAIVAVIVVATLAFTTVWDRIHPKPGLEEVKQAWEKETLILTIHDSEEYWERPPTPVETLEGMSEAELRDLLDQIAEEEVPPPPPWEVLAAVGALGVLGIGAAMALTMAKPAE